MIGIGYVPPPPHIIYTSPSGTLVVDYGGTMSGTDWFIVYVLSAMAVGFFCWFMEDDYNEAGRPNLERFKRMCTWMFLFPVVAARWFWNWVRR